MPLEQDQSIDRELFFQFCSKLLIPAKEGGKDGQTLIPLIPLPTQIYLIDEIIKGLQEGIHFFTVLKCRQSGITTIGLAFDLYWCWRHDGVIFNFVADTSKRTNYNRSLLKDFVASLKSQREWYQPVQDDNRDMITFNNRSKIIWNNANGRDEGGLGRGTGVVGCHCTEVGLYKDEEGVASLLSSLSLTNRNRFYLLEGTAQGPNLFRELCDEADREGNTSQKFIFIGWWLQPDYDCDLNTEDGLNRYRTYWETSPRVNYEESIWVNGVKDRYGWTVTPTQMAWFRYHLRELKMDNLEMMYQEYPPLPEYAWRYGGRTFISGTKLMEKRLAAERREQIPRLFQFGFGNTFLETGVHEVGGHDWYDLMTWDEPVKGPMVRYVIGVDPAYGATEEGDHAAVQVYRCYSDKAVQVAEFCRREIPTYQLAWVVLHLAGAYNSETILNVELAGGGFAVMEEIKRLQSEMTMGYNSALIPHFQNLYHYVYLRPDHGGRSGALHWQTTPSTKERMMNHYRDFFERGGLEVRSLELIKETEAIQRLRSGELETGAKNHRLMAAAIAIMAYIQCLEFELGGTKYDEEYFKLGEKAQDGKITPAEVLNLRMLDWQDSVIQADIEKRKNMKPPRWAKRI